MPYWDIVTRSFRIAWNRKYLWLLALFSGEASTGFNFNYSQGSRSANPDVASMQQQIQAWVQDNAGLIVLIFVLWIVLFVALFILAAVCEGATIRASAEHDADRPFGLRLAWRMGVHTVWVIVRFRLLLVALYLPLLLLFAAWVVGLVAAIAKGDGGAVALLALTGLLLLLLGLVYGTYVYFLDRLGARAIVLEERKAAAGLARAHRLLLKRFWRSILVLLLAIAIALVTGIVLGCFAAIVGLPFAIAIAASGGAAFWPLFVIGVVILLPVYLVVGGFLAAQGSTYWTLAFRRLDVDYAPAYGYPAMPPPAPQQ